MQYHPPTRRSPLVQGLLRAAYLGTRRYCAVCRSHVRSFGTFGRIKRKDARCPVCGAVERHRLTWAFFEQRTDLFDGKPKRMLHIAPEPAFEQRLRAVPFIEYITADSQDHKADVTMDITDIRYPDGAFDVILCSHVLEHVQEDLKAMRELARVLSPTGWAAVLVPVTAERTFDDPSVTDPAERERLFGQWDHVRVYGPDVQDRLASSGFDVQVIRSQDLLPDPVAQEKQQFKSEELYYCRRAQAPVQIDGKSGENCERSKQL